MKSIFRGITPASAVGITLLLALPLILLFASSPRQQFMFPETQYDAYEKLWKVVDSLDQQGLTKAALENVQSIYTLAKKSDNAPQIVKSLIYLVKYSQVLEEGGFEKALEAFEEEIGRSHFPTKNILQSACAELYWTYYERNRWQFSQRTSTMSRPEDIATWDLKTITNRVTELYKASLENSDSLKQTPIADFDAILIKGNSPTLRPTLYDFLTHRALDFFMNEEAYLTQPAYKFTLGGDDFFLQASDFISLKIETRDTTSGKYLALLILQELLHFHLNDKNPGAVVDADLKRFQFLKNNSVHELKDSLYIKGILQLEGRYASDSASAPVSFAIAQFYLNRSQDYDPPVMNDHRWDKKTALEYCDKVIKKFPVTRAAKNCKALRESIFTKNVSLTTEQVNLPGEPFRAYVRYRNVDTIFLRIIRKTKEQEEKILERGEERKVYEMYLSQPILQEWAQSLPKAGDYQEHGVEIKIPALPLGEYIILGSGEKKFSLDSGGVFHVATTISTLSYISKRTGAGYAFYVLDRESGSPLKDVEARLFSREYDYSKRQYRFNEKGKYTTDINGFFKVPGTSSNENFMIEFLKGNDKLTANDYFYLYRYEQEKRKSIRTIFFTDRAIYRPGQTVYFKGVVIETDGDKNSLQTKYKTTVEFYDVNNQKLQSLNLETNDYGSFNGSFVAPASGLNGMMTIRNNSGSVSISVEEYKRPKFEVVFDTLKGSYRLNDEVKVSGTAKSYSGANIDGATVNYRVVRQAKFPFYHWGWKRGYYERFSQQMEIENGSTITDANGAFNISFTAIPDAKIPEKEKPQFSYKVYADVVDITGETHSGETFTTIGYAALNADISIPENVSRDSVQTFKITTENLNGVFEPAQGNIAIYQLVQPERIFRKRLWERPDQFAMTRDEYYKTFPYDVYDNEDDFTTWSKASKVVDQPFNTADSKDFSSSAIAKLPQGKYVVQLTAKDRYGEEIKAEKYFTFYSNREKELPLNELFWVSAIPTKAEAGEVLSFQFGSVEKNNTILYELEAKNNYSEQQLIQWKKDKESITIPVTESFKGGFRVALVSVRHGRVNNFSQTINVPYTDKELKLEFETFRNKLLPGQNEEWKLKITGSKGGAVAAEMVAAMYDASLDAFRPNNWMFDIFQYFYPRFSFDPGNCFGADRSDLYAPGWNKYPGFILQMYDQLNWFGFETHYVTLYDFEENQNMIRSAPVARDGVKMTKKEEAPAASAAFEVTADTIKEDFGQVSVRKNLQETAFFFPSLQTDETGNIIIQFSIPEALTRWKFMGFAHSKDLANGMITKETITQKDLMVTPNAPRFFREGDKIYFAAKITNLSDRDLTGSATLQLFDASSMKSADVSFVNTKNVQSFSVKKGSNVPMLWELTVPEGIEMVNYKVIAKAGDQSDGEENVLPVLTNRMLVTESLPLNIRSNTSKNFTFTKLLQSGSSSTLRNHKLTLEVTGNPAWYAVQALPYMMEYPYECSEQVFNRYYANALASHIANANPKIKQVFETWKNADAGALVSNLDKNQELKSLLLQETPWVLEAQDESERKKRIALLFDLNRMSYEMDATLNKLGQLQTPNGGWAWFPGMPDNRFITQYIVSGLGHLDRLGVSLKKGSVNTMSERAIVYLDKRIAEDYEKLLKEKAKLDENHLSNEALQYLYARSFFTDIPVAEESKKAFEYYKSQAQKFWLKQNIYGQGMIALALKRFDNSKTAQTIMRSLKENSITSEELGMYWKTNQRGYYWYQAPIETQALLIEAFGEISNDNESIENMKLWLLKQKQTNDWQTTKATSDAVYALLLRGGDWLAAEPALTVSLGNTIVDLSNESKEAGTGYFKTSWNPEEITAAMGNIKVSSSGSNNTISWGAVYWQYFEQLDKITPAETPLKLQKHLFIQRNTESGPVIEAINEGSQIKPGDLIKVRIELRVDRDMEYVHMKDMRAACFEPVNVFSVYKWQDGLGYYEETKDASTNFFFDYLRKGTYVFEYPLRAQLKGNFSNGITSIQCMYAPEFTSHSEGVRVKVE